MQGGKTHRGKQKSRIAKLGNATVYFRPNQSFTPFQGCASVSNMAGFLAHAVLDVLQRLILRLLSFRQ